MECLTPVFRFLNTDARHGLLRVHSRHFGAGWAEWPVSRMIFGAFGQLRTLGVSISAPRRGDSSTALRCAELKQGSEASPTMLSTIALFSSSRRHGNTGAVLDKISAELRFEIVDLAECNIAPYDYAHANRSDGFEPLMSKIVAHDQIVFAAPVYWYSVPPKMKSFIDRLNDLLEIPDLREKGRLLRGKRAFVVATSGIAEVSPAFISMFRDTFAYLGMQYCGHLHVNCDGGYKTGAGERDIAVFEALLRGQ